MSEDVELLRDFFDTARGIKSETVGFGNNANLTTAEALDMEPYRAALVRLSTALEAAEARVRQADENAAVLADQRDALMHAMRAEEPPNEVFLALQRLHGLPEIGSPSARLEAAEADARQAEERIEQIGKLGSDLLLALTPWDFHGDAVRSAAARLTVALAAIPLPAGRA